MTTEEEKKLRVEAILGQLQDCYPTGLSVDRLLPGLKLAGHTISAERAQKDLEGLIAAGLVERRADPLSPALKTFVLTQKGIASL